MLSICLFTLLIAFTGLERLLELRVSNHNARWSFAHGGHEIGRGHYPFMVLLHTGLLIACITEVWLLKRPFTPLWGGLFLMLAIVSQGLRWWCIRTLGQRWNTRVIVIPGLSRITIGPYRFLSHPNYVAVVLEGIALPMVHNAWITAISFTVLNAALLWVRIGVENNALNQMESTAQL